MKIKKNNPWNINLIVFGHLSLAILIFSLFCPSTKSFWAPLDEGCFRILNGWIKESFFFQNFWAMANHRVADLVEDFFFILFFTWVIKSQPKGEKIKKAAECLFILIYSAFIILAANEVLFRVILHIHRKSPTLVMDSFVYLPEKIKWLKIKAKSPISFPGDHATTALLFITGFIYLARKNLKIQISAILYGIFLILPRLIVGAHWLTDVLIGSGSIVSFFFMWAFGTPLASSSIKILENSLQIIRKAVSRKKLYARDLPHD